MNMYVPVVANWVAFLYFFRGSFSGQFLHISFTLLLYCLISFSTSKFCLSLFGGWNHGVSVQASDFYLLFPSRL